MKTVSNNKLNGTGVLSYLVFWCFLLLFSNISFATSHTFNLNENCVVSILNRTVQAQADGNWLMPNVPSSLGRVRARAACVENGITTVAQSDYFSIIVNNTIQVGAMTVGDEARIPVSLTFSHTGAINLFGAGSYYNLRVFANYRDGSRVNVTAASNGTNYSSANPAIANIDENGLIEARAAGSVLISARKDGVLIGTMVTISTGNDADNDGLPDEFELALGLNPRDPIDAQEDLDNDGLTALEEFNFGTLINEEDTDSDGILDGEEVVVGADGFISDPLSSDGDGDGLSDSLEVLAGSDPLNAADISFAGILTSFDVSPLNFSLINNTIQPDEVGQQLTVTGTLIDGSTIDLTDTSRGTSYTSSDLTVCNFGVNSGLIFGSGEGNCEITVANDTETQLVSASVFSFNPVAVSVVSISGYANNVDVDGDYAYVAAGSAGLTVVDLADKTNPSVLASLDTSGTSIDIKVDAGIAYVADGASGLQIIDVSSPELPSLISGVNTPGVAQDLQILNGFVYLADGSSGLQIADVSDPFSPTLIGQVNGIGTAKGVDVQGNIAVVGTTSGLYIIDISQPAFPVVLGNLNLTNIKDLTIEGSYVHVAAYTTGYRVVDIANPQNPTVVGQGTGSDFVARDVAVNANIAFYSEQLFPNAIAYVNVQEPTAPIFSGTINLSGLGDYAGTGIDVDQRHVYITGESFVVGSDYGSSGTTVLMIAQYRQITDNEGIAPQVQIVSPESQQAYIQGETVTITVNATDDVFVANVQLLVNDVVVATDSGSPYEFRYQTPADIVGELNITAVAFDLGGNNTTSALIVIQLTEDPLTTVTGQIIDNNNAPVPNATVTCLAQTATSDASGNFSVTQVPTIADVGCSVVATIGGTQFTGISAPVIPVRSGLTDIGQITVRSATFDNDYGTGLNQSDDDYDFRTFTDGFTFPFFGVNYSGVYINSNGRLTFNFGDRTYTESFGEFTNQPQIAVFFDDLDPRRGGDVFYKQLTDRFVVTWDRVAHYRYGGSNTIQMTLYADGRITFGYNGLTAQGAFVGVSTGDSLGATALDLSGAPFSIGQPVSIYEAFIIGSNNFDLDGNFILFTPQGNGFDVDVVPLQ